MSTDPSPSPDEPLSAWSPAENKRSLIIDGISYIPSSVLLSGINRLSFKDDRAFGVVDPRGEAPRAYSEASELGIYYNDTRYLSLWETLFNGLSPIPLANQLRYGGNTIVVSMTNPDLPTPDGGRIPRDTLLIRRFLSFVGDRLFENVVIRNFDTVTRTLEIEQWIGGSFDDIFEVRGFIRPKKGRLLPFEERRDAKGSESILYYEGLDGRVRSSHIHRLFPNRKILLADTSSAVQARIVIPPKSDFQLKTVVAFDQPWNEKIRDERFADLTVNEFVGAISNSRKNEALGGARIETDNAILNRAIHNARVDIRMLLTSESDGNVYPYAGIPWFSAPFGRDGIITAYQLLPWYPELAKGVLEYIWTTQGSRIEPFTDEQPGKIFHEMRRGEMASLREVPFIPYFGSVDSTPLALILLHEYVRWSGDLESLRRWWPSALRALEWVLKVGAPGPQGFLEYARLAPTGLVNQGWKDSHDSIMHADGRLAEAPIRLCEAQAYSFRARTAMAELALTMGDPGLSEDLRRGALRFKAFFRDHFWNADRGFVNLALDRNNAPCEVMSSNMGHCLWARLLDAEQVESVTRHLMDDSMFSGYGVRTLADTELAYNPLSYHNGSIWPHDCSIILEGLRMHHQTAAVSRLGEAMLSVLESSQDFRLPELFCGFRKRANEPPVPYQVACKPQAWAAGSIFLMLKAMLGLELDPSGKHLIFHSPRLWDKVTRMDIHGLQARGWTADIRIEATNHGARAQLIRSTGDIRVLTLK